jgi:hypothetical protein
MIGRNSKVLLSLTLVMMHTLGFPHLLYLKNAEFEVAEDATKAQIKSAFVKSLKTKKLNKKVLGEFVWIDCLINN